MIQISRNMVSDNSGQFYGRQKEHLHFEMAKQN